jgi:hypothetical protein
LAAQVGFPMAYTMLVGTCPPSPLQVPPPLLPPLDDVEPPLELPLPSGGGFELLLQAENTLATAASVNANEEVFREISMGRLS